MTVMMIVIVEVVGEVMVIIDVVENQYTARRVHGAPCAENDKIDVLAIGASMFMGNYLPLLQKLLHTGAQSGAEQSESIQQKHSPTDLFKRLDTSEK